MLDPPLSGRKLTVGLEQRKSSHHDLNLTLSYATSATGDDMAHASYAITAEFRTTDRGSYVGDEGDEAAAAYGYDAEPE